VEGGIGLSGSGSVARSGFARLTAEVALGRVGLVLGLEVSRLARNNADWHRLIDL
jgi:DNA invertase Pin-like site-specific DNA recombinase